MADKIKCKCKRCGAEYDFIVCKCRNCDSIEIKYNGELNEIK